MTYDVQIQPWNRQIEVDAQFTKVPLTSELPEHPMGHGLTQFTT